MSKTHFEPWTEETLAGELARVRLGTMRYITFSDQVDADGTVPVSANGVRIGFPREPLALGPRGDAYRVCSSDELIAFINHHKLMFRRELR